MKAKTFLKALNESSKRQDERLSRAVKVFKPYIVKRPNGGCQVLFPLTMLDEIVDKIIRRAE